METIGFSELRQHKSYLKPGHWSLQGLDEIVRPVADRFGEDNVFFLVEEHCTRVDLAVLSPAGELYDLYLPIRRRDQRLDDPALIEGHRQARVQRYISAIDDASQSTNGD